MTRGDRVYRLLLRLYPREFRARYQRAMMDFHRDRVAAARQAHESMTALWLRTIADALKSAAIEHARNFFSGEPVIETIAQDLAFGVRSLSRRPAFTAIVVATIALGVGANAAIFSVVNGILLRPLPYPHAERVVSFGHEPPTWLTSDPNFIDYRREMKSFDGLAAYVRRDGTLTIGDQPERIRMVRASEDFFPVLGVRPEIGRAFSSDEYVPRVAPVAVISHALWETRFGGDPNIVGRKVTLEGTPRVIVGVMPRFFDFPEARTDLWMPMARFNPDSLGDRSNNYLFMVARLKPNVTIGRARNEATMIAQHIMRDYPNSFNPKNPIRPHITSVREDLVGKTRPYLLALLAAVGFVLLIASANVANLLLVRGEARHKEMAVRNALGASRFRLVSQLLTESTVLAGVGGVLGLLVAWAGDRALVALAPPSIPRLDAIAIDWRVVAFTAFVATATGLLIGLLPAWRASRGNSVDALRDAGRVVGARGGAKRVRRALVIAEVALAVTTLSGAGMLLRSLWNLQSTDLGFVPGNTLTAKVALPPREYDNHRSEAFFDQLLEKARAIPGVTAAGAAGWLPVVDAGGLWGIQQEGKPQEVDWPNAVPQHATPGYFKAIGLPVVAGRDFTSNDRDGALPVAVVSEQFAKKVFPGASPLGKRFKLGGPGPFMTIVGVVGDVRARGFDDTPEPTMYFPYAQSARNAYYMPRSMAILLRVDGDAQSVGPTVREIVRSLDRTVPVSEMRTLEQVVGTSVSSRRFNTGLLAGFALLALVLAGIGTYGVISYAVSQRSHEIGVRMALGAEDRSVLMLVMSEGLRLCLIGVGIGLVVSAGVGRTIRAMLVGVPPIDVPTLAVTAVLLIAVGALASALPARRALSVSPTETLRG
jgi:putative ABC transport system permease protein